MKKLIFAGVLSTLMLGTSCTRNAGLEISENRSVSDFESIKLESAANIFITQDTAYDIKVDAGQNLMPYVETEVIDNTLIVSEKNNRIWRNNTVNVYVSTDYLKSITVDGSGDVIGAGFATDQFRISVNGSGDLDLSPSGNISTVIAAITGSGDIKLEGTTDSIFVEIDGSGDLKARLMKAKHGDVYIRGSGSVQVWTDESIKIYIDGSGDVEYWGNPPSEYYDIKGSGDAISR